MSMNTHHIRQQRTQFYANLAKQEKVQLIFPLYPQGPKFIKGQEKCPASVKELVNMCVQCYTNSVNTDIYMTVYLSDVIDSLNKEAESDGLAIHLLPWYPFSMPCKIVVDGKYECISDYDIVQTIVKAIVKQDDFVWINVPNDKYLEQVLIGDASILPRQQLEDPLVRGDGVWVNGFLLPHYDKAYETQHVLGQYVIHNTVLQAKCNAMKKHFSDFQPHYILSQNCPIDIALIKRYQKACTLFHYDYAIERMPLKPKCGLGFLRVPNLFCDKVDQILREYQPSPGFTSLKHVVKSLLQSGTVNRKDKEGIDKIIHLLRHVSYGEENIESSQNRRWIFAYNRVERNGSVTLPGDCLDFNMTNLTNKNFTRSLHTLEEQLDVDLCNYENTKQIHQDIVIGFPMGCDLQSRKNPQVLCPMRFKDNTTKFAHIRHHHGISKGDEKIINHLETGGLILKNITMESEQEWLESRKLLDNFDKEELIQRSDLAELFTEFVVRHYTLMEAVVQLEQLLGNLENTMECTRQAHQDVLKHSTEPHEKETALNAISGMDNTVGFCRRLIHLQQAMLLSFNRLEEHLVAWCNALTVQTKAMERFNKSRDRIWETQLRSQQMCNSVLSELIKERERAGFNVGSISPESLLQSAGGTNKLGIAQIEKTLLAMAGYQARLEEESAKAVLEPYLKKPPSGPGKDSFKRDDITRDSQMHDGDLTKEVEETCQKSVAMPLGNHYDSEDDQDVCIITSNTYITNQSTTIVPSVVGQLPKKPSYGCKRKPDWTVSSYCNDAPLVVKTMKMAEGCLTEQRVHTLQEFDDLINWHNLESPKIDSRSISMQDFQCFVGGTKMVPGSEVIKVGKGHSRDVTTYEVIDPLTIMVDIRDYRDLMFYILTMMKSRNCRLVQFKTIVTNAMMTVLNILFRLTLKGNTVIREGIDKAIMKKTNSMKTVSSKLREEMWLVFLNAIKLLNLNGLSGGQLNELFCVRFSKHGDVSMVPIKTAGEEDYSYDKTIVIDQGAIIDYLCRKHQNTEISHSSPIKVNHEQFFDKQKILHEKILHQFKQDVDFNHHQMHGGQLLAITDGPKDKKQWKHHTKDTLGQSSRSDRLNWQYHVDMPLYMQNHKDLESEHRNHDMTPTYTMSTDDLNVLDKEINQVREQVCTICLEQYSNRPLEGLNCIYKELERDFRKVNNISQDVSLEKNKHVFEKYQSFVSQNIAAKTRGTKSSIDANGMHLFHTACLRRHIQIQALDFDRTNITCPNCKREVYNSVEKDVIVGNIEELSSRLGECANSESIATYTTDDLINLKGDLRTSGGDPLLRYFTSTSIKETHCVKEDSSLTEEMKVNMKQTEVSFARPMNVEKTKDYRVEYENFAIKTPPEKFTPDGLAEIVLDKKMFHLQPNHFSGIAV